jgi:NAD(P)-dependent dehydrogenase (short-subunit alcohol dehydrogenase family)
MLRLDGKVALVTGCGSSGPGWGNGKAIAVLLARQGASVFGVDCDRAAAEATCALIREEGGTAEVETFDVTLAADVTRMAQACLARFGRIDILINNVGRSEPGGPVEMEEQTWDEQMDVNVKSAFLTCKTILPIMERQGSGAVVNISSVAGLRYAGKPQVAYAAAKAALMQLCRA